MISRLIVVSAIAVIPSVAVAQSSPDPYAIYKETFPADGVELGRGWLQNLAKGASMSCVIGQSKPLALSDVTFSFEEVVSREQAYKSLNINAAAVYGAFSASAYFANSTDTARSNVNVMAVVNVRRNGFYWAPPDGKSLDITPDKLKVLNEAKGKSPAEQRAALKTFFDVCGDSYVAAIESGAKYAARFTKALDSTVQETMYGASASGGFGRFKASLSMSSAMSTMLSKEDTRIATTQTGGDLVLPMTSAEAYSRIKNFAENVAKANTSVPQTLVLRPYESHPQFPPAYLGMRTSPERVAAIAGMADRFSKLSDDYRAAFFSLYAYQFPLQAINLKSVTCGASKEGTAKDPAVDPVVCLRKELSQAAELTGIVATCLDKIVQWCRRDAVCNVERIPLGETEVLACSNTTDLMKIIGDQVLTTSRIATGKIASADTELLTTQQAIATDIANLYTSTPGASAAQTVTQFDAVAAAQLYLAQLAVLPLQGTPDGTGIDLPNIAKMCLLYSKDGCEVTSLPTQQDAQLLPINNGLREWVLANRMGKEIDSACAMSLNHPLCTSMNSALAIATLLKPAYGEPRRFNVAAKPPSTQPEAPKIPIPPKRPPNECFLPTLTGPPPPGGRCNFQLNGIPVLSKLDAKK